jgi:hypothetical protein
MEYVAIVCNSRKNGELLARMVKPFRGNFWTNKHTSAGRYTTKEASDIMKTLKYNDPRVAPFADIVAILKAQKVIVRAHS